MIEYLGQVSRAEVNSLYGESRVGVVLYQPEENHVSSQPNKLFEYMAAGLPVLASDFMLWKEIIEENDCGICVPPADVIAVRRALVEMLQSPELCSRMGHAGRRAVEELYNWDTEKTKLIELYESVLS